MRNLQESLGYIELNSQNNERKSVVSFSLKQIETLFMRSLSSQRQETQKFLHLIFIFPFEFRLCYFNFDLLSLTRRPQNEHGLGSDWRVDCWGFRIFYSRESQNKTNQAFTFNFFSKVSTVVNRRLLTIYSLNICLF